MSQAKEIRYLYDQNGNRTDVVIPISVWSEDIEQIIKEKFLGEEIFDPTKYMGIIHYTGTFDELDKEINGMRDEWDRI